MSSTSARPWPAKCRRSKAPGFRSSSPHVALGGLDRGGAEGGLQEVALGPRLREGPVGVGVVRDDVAGLAGTDPQPLGGPAAEQPAHEAHLPEEGGLLRQAPRAGLLQVHQLPRDERLGAGGHHAAQALPVGPEDRLQLLGHQLLEQLDAEGPQLLLEIPLVAPAAEPPVLDELVEVVDVGRPVGPDGLGLEALVEPQVGHLEVELVHEVVALTGLGDLELAERLPLRRAPGRGRVGGDRAGGATGAPPGDDLGRQLQGHDRDLALPDDDPDLPLPGVRRLHVEQHQGRLAGRRHRDLRAGLPHDAHVGLREGLEDQRAFLVEDRVPAGADRARPSARCPRARR